ncbi:hypothetical protein SEEA0292_16567 [Salmonella enterica subsp. enterica serovar Agona str. 0292]|nr:hypothetical protein SEEERB17_023589 [Salmonella enterica subsp. enterica serovar Enteritidis str. SARB17]ELX34167.1 hypothetical protein SEER_00470 [Salmonella enterica subsp. enterica serovar Rissen str. 150]ELX48713.1 hypothetical protein SEET535_17531 [Salmonella enterica subsp. enterica serovar Tennessee str. 4535]ESB62638.1 hypothetical protein SEEA7571_18414 [Salmonella enterica subsp. enterica serovar Agona str. 266757-1]ESC19366.1 hypothetical protein SEEA0292_16567 [Salmonella ente
MAVLVSLYIMLSPLYGDDDAKENLGRFIDTIVPHRLPPDDQPINSQR